MTSIASRYLEQPFELQDAAPPRLDYRGVAGPPPPLDLQGLYAHIAPTSDQFVDALSITDQINRAALRAFAGQAEDS